MLYPRAGSATERSYPASEVRSSGCALLEQLWIGHIQGKRNPRKTVGVARVSEGRHTKTIITEN